MLSTLNNYQGIIYHVVNGILCLQMGFVLGLGLAVVVGSVCDLDWVYLQKMSMLNKLFLLAFRYVPANQQHAFLIQTVVRTNLMFLHMPISLLQLRSQSTH